MYVRLQYTYAYINYMICDVWHFCFPCLQDLPNNSVAPCLFVSVFESLNCKSQNLAHHTVANVPSGHPVLQGPCHNEQPDPGLDMKQNFRRMLSKKQETSCKRSKRSNCNKHIKTSKSSKRSKYHGYTSIQNVLPWPSLLNIRVQCSCSEKVHSSQLSTGRKIDMLENIVKKHM